MRFSVVVVFFLCCCYSAEENKPIQTFVIPHSHMDVGWVYTIQVGSVTLFFIRFQTLQSLCTACCLTVACHRIIECVYFSFYIMQMSVYSP